MAYTCKRCGRKIWVVESIIRGMGPICYGKAYSMRRMLKRGMTREEILKIPKEEIERLAKQELRRWRRKQKKKKTIKLKSGKIRMRKIKSKKDKAQKTLDSFIFNLESGGIVIKPTSLYYGEPPEEIVDIEELKNQLYKITNSLSTTTGSTETTKAIELMDKIKELENKK